MSFSYVKIEEKIIQYWRENDIFQKQLEKNKDKEKFSYFDGPPFATGLPHYGHIVASILKDVIPRYKAMCGYDVPRKWCWDVHGLPIEFEIEKKLGIKTKEDVLCLGIEKYNEECRKIVMKYSEEWKKTIERIGRWVDMENNVKTMDKDYMNGVWWVFNNMWNNLLVYQGVKVMPYSTGCATPLSNFEAKSNYQKINDPSITVKFYINDNTSFLVWTTTPWTLPSNLALCVHPELEYVKILHNNSYYILLPNQLQKYGFSKENIQEKIYGKSLVGTKYIPLYPYYQLKYPNAFCIVADKYVKDDNGTGIVHQAPAFGEDDYRVCLDYNIINKMGIIPCPFDANGNFTDEIELVKNLYFKDADKIIMKDLTERNLMFQQKWESHEYPFCWRSNKPLMYRIVPCTFINVEKIKEKIIANNQETKWVPSHLKNGRFGNWLEEAKDWCVSRNRFWGTPIPIWKSNDGDTICIDSSYTLEQLANLPQNSIKDMHRHYIDQIVIEKNGKQYKRVEEVFDCWFESGSLPFASQNYPYSNVNNFSYPADYIAEGLDQTRGWFYTLMVIGTAIFDKSPFKNVIVNGLVLAEDGEKMSKSKKNYPDPTHILDKYGADALRLYLIGTQIVKGEPLKFRENGVSNIVKNIHQFIFNTLTFLQQMIPLYEQKYEKKFLYYNFQKQPPINNIMDIMILNYLQEFTTDIHKEMHSYYLGNIVDRIEKFIFQLSKTYLNMNKSRLKSQTTEKDALDSLNTVFYIMKIFSIIIAPFAPFMAEHIFQNLCNTTSSVHLQNMPTNVWLNKGIGQEGIHLIETIITARGELRSSVLKTAKKPVLQQTIYLNNSKLIPFLENIKYTLQNECNTLIIHISAEYNSLIKKSFQFNNPIIGKKYKKDAKKFKNELQLFLKDNFQHFQETNNIIFPFNGINHQLTNEINIIDELNHDKIPNNLHVQFYQNEGMIILSDLTWNDQLEKKYWTRVISRNIMNSRKKMGLIPTDNAILKYKSSGINDILTENREEFIRQLGMDIQKCEMENGDFKFVENNYYYDFCISLL